MIVLIWTRIQVRDGYSVKNSFKSAQESLFDK
jgi:hypothetical protein